jgi:hypothetical protein
MPHATVDLYRLARAVHLDAEPTGYGHVYQVQSGERQYTVNLERDECTCEDSQRGHYCKHRIAGALREGDPVVLRSLRWLIPMPKPSNRARSSVTG